MMTRLTSVLAAGVMFAATQGCSCPSMQACQLTSYDDSAQSSAGMVVYGDVTDVSTMTRYQSSEIASAGLEGISTQCVAQEKGQMNVQQTYKGPHQNSPLTFYYYAPCATPRPVAPGDHTTIYLHNHDGQWWMTGRKLPEETNRPEGYIKQRKEIY